jgi:hypothetical protein
MTVSSSAVQANREGQTVPLVGYRSRRPHYGNASSCARELVAPPPEFRLSLAQAVSREIRSLFRRIAEIRKQSLDLQGVSINPCPELSLPLEQRESALKCCIQDIRNLYASRPGTTLIDVQLFHQGWKCGVASLLRSRSTEPHP